MSTEHKRHRGLRPLLGYAPKVYVGPGAEGVLRGERCVLLGARRFSWVDVLEIGPAGGRTLSSLVDSRFQAVGSWDAVGVSLPGREGVMHKTELLSALVPGDVLVSNGRPLVHMGDRWERAALICERDVLSKRQRAT